MPTKGGPQTHGITTLSDNDGISVGRKESGARSNNSDCSRSNTSVGKTGNSEDARSVGKHVSNVGGDHDRVEDIHRAKPMKDLLVKVGARAVAAVAIVIRRKRATAITASNSTRCAQLSFEHCILLAATFDRTTPKDGLRFYLTKGKFRAAFRCSRALYTL